jgi:putative hydrolase of the HAD superfamily
MLFPDVIFFDAVGTLFGVRGSVGQIYGAIARKFQVSSDFEALDRAFLQNFKAASKMAFPKAERSQIPEYEYKWWYDIAKSTFTQVGAFEQFQDFDAYFGEMYNFFATPAAWYIYPDVIPVLDYLQNQGMELGIISNFDSRIHTVLSSLGINKFFTTVTISTEVGAAKPDAQIFQSAIAKHRQDFCTQNFWHIGDSYKEDFEGAENANSEGFRIKGIWLDRSGNSGISSFSDLIELVQKSRN